MRGALLLLLLGTAATARAQEPPPCPFPGQTPKLLVQLFFGQSVEGRGLISHRSWQRFVAESVTASFPDGFTVFDAYGQWMDQATHVIGREATEVVEVAADDTPASPGSPTSTGGGSSRSQSAS